MVIGKTLPLESLVTERMLMFESARIFDEVCLETGKSIDGGSLVEQVANKWYNIYHGSHNQVIGGIDIYAYNLANETCKDYIFLAYKALRPHLRGEDKDYVSDSE